MSQVRTVVRGRGSHVLAALIAGTIVLIAGAAPAQAAGPLITATSFSGVTQATATLEASVNPNGGLVKDAHFDYISQADYEADGESFGTGTLSTPAVKVPLSVKGSGSLESGSGVVEVLATTSGSFGPGQAIEGEGIAPGTTIKAAEVDPETGTGQLTLSSPATITKAGVELKATGPQPISARIEGLAPATAYRFRAVAENNQGKAEGPAIQFFTAASEPIFRPCPNDLFRSGEFAPFGHPSAALPDCRAYERASPLDKDGGDLVGDPDYIHAAASGAAVTFGTTFGVPGGQGAQDFPFFLASRGPGEQGWSTSGLMPPESTGQKAHPLIGWLPDFSASFATAVRLHSDAPAEEGLFELHPDGSAPTQIGPYTPGKGETYGYAGASADGQTVAIEAVAALPAEEGGPALAGASTAGHNVYAWDAQSGQLHLASTMNTPLRTEELLAGGAFAGPYDFSRADPTAGGALANYYLQEERAVAEDGSVFFTAAGSGQLYERLNPTQPQSALDGEGHCIEPDKACTLALSATRRTPPDSVGSAPAAFQAASADGRTAYYTSSEKLTDDANTGPEQPEAAIGRATLNGEAPPNPVDESFLAAHALGLAVDPAGEFIYWANPAQHSIGRAKLNPSTGEPEQEEPTYIVPGETSFETRPRAEPGVLHSAPATPRYVAVDAEHVYWTNTGPLGEGGFTGATDKPVDGAGTIGRATIDPEGHPEDVRADFITGASNPQGIAVNAEFVYWGNASRDGVKAGIGRADISGNKASVEQQFLARVGSFPAGLALTPTYLYFSENDPSDFSMVRRIPLNGSEADEKFLGLGKSALRGIAIDATHLYWVAQGEGSIGRVPLADFPESFPFNCFERATCNSELLQPQGSLFGLATDPAGHLYWSANGEAPPNPGNDLYRFRAPGAGGCAEARGCLDDLTADPGTENGAEVVGILGASRDGSRLYFAANADLDGPGPATPGDCGGRPGTSARGSCSLYLLDEGQIAFLARLEAGGGTLGDSLDWSSDLRPAINGGSFLAKTSLLSADGRALIFRSQAQLTGYDNHGSPEFYRYRVGEGILCLTCNPTGAAPSAVPGFDTFLLPSIGPLTVAATVSPRFLAAEGDRAFFETAEALVLADTNGEGGCPRVGSGSQEFASCQDVYEWEAPGTGSCEAGGPGYSPLNGGCVYLISTGKEAEPSFFADASESGEDVFILTRSRLVGQDTDSITDVYDARVEGGLAAQNPLPAKTCEGEGCKGAATPPPAFQAPPAFSGPSDPKPNHKKHRRKKHKKRHQGHHRHHHHAQHHGGAK